jgi:hypothetical protein
LLASAYSPQNRTGRWQRTPKAALSETHLITAVISTKGRWDSVFGELAFTFVITRAVVMCQIERYPSETPPILHAVAQSVRQVAPASVA